MPKPNIPDLLPWDVSNINRALQTQIGLDRRNLRELQEKRQYAFRAGNKKYEEELAAAIQRLQRTMMRSEKLLEIFKNPSVEELSFNEWV